MYTISLRVDNELKEAIAEYSSINNMNQSDLIRIALSDYLKEQKNPKKKGRMAQLAGNIIGSESSPRDLSTNPKYMEGFGE